MIFCYFTYQDVTSQTETETAELPGCFWIHLFTGGKFGIRGNFLKENYKIIVETINFGRQTIAMFNHNYHE